MKLLLTIIAGVFLLTYAWGWVIHVQDGFMDTHRYTEYYLNEVKERTLYFVKEPGKIIEWVKKPLPARKEFGV